MLHLQGKSYLDYPKLLRPFKISQKNEVLFKNLIQRISSFSIILIYYTFQAFKRSKQMITRPLNNPQKCLQNTSHMFSHDISNFQVINWQFFLWAIAPPFLLWLLLLKYIFLSFHSNYYTESCVKVPLRNENFFFFWYWRTYLTYNDIDDVNVLYVKFKRWKSLKRHKNERWRKCCECFLTAQCCTKTVCL